jgi:hypothetical protein
MPILDRITGGLLNARVQQAMSARDAALYQGDIYQPAPELTPETAARICGANDCTNPWVKPWKSRKRPIFEDDWGCSSRCLQTIVRSAVRREVGEGGAASAELPHRHRVPLGLVLLAQGWITHPQLQKALDAQRASGQGRIGEWLAQSCGLPEEQIVRGLGVQWSCPVLAMEGFSPAAMALVVPKRFIAEFGLVPLRVAGSSILYLAFLDRLNAAAAFGVEQMTGLKVESGLLPQKQFETVRAAVLAADGVPAGVSLVADADELTAKIVSSLERRQPVAARLVRIHQYYWLRTWLETGALSGVGQIPRSSEDVEDQLYLVGESHSEDSRAAGTKAAE